MNKSRSVMKMFLMESTRGHNSISYTRVNKDYAEKYKPNKLATINTTHV